MNDRAVGSSRWEGRGTITPVLRLFRYQDVIKEIAQNRSISSGVSGVGAGTGSGNGAGAGAGAGIGSDEKKAKIDHKGTRTAMTDVRILEELGLRRRSAGKSSVPQGTAEGRVCWSSTAWRCPVELLGIYMAWPPGFLFLLLQ